MRIFRGVIAGAALILALTALVGFAAPYLVDGRTVRDQLVAKLSAWSEGELRVDGEIRLTSLFDLTIEAEDVRVESPARFPSVSDVSADLVAARLNVWDLLNGRVVFAKVWLERPMIRLRKPLQEITRNRLWRAMIIDESEALVRVIEAAQDAPFEFIEFTDARITGGSSSDENKKRAYTWSATVARQSESQAVLAEGQLTRDAETVRFTARRGVFRPAGPTLEAPVRLVTESEASGRVAVDGRIVRANGTRFIGRLEVQNATVSTLTHWLDLPGSETLLGARYSAAAALEATQNELSLQQVDLEVSETQVTGLLNLGLNGQKPNLSGTLSLSTVDLRNVLPSDWTGGVLVNDPDIKEGDESLLSSRLLAAWLDSFDVDLRISADGLRLGGFTTGETAVFLSVTDGRATLDIAELLIFDGIVNGQFSLRRKGDWVRLTGKGNATGIDLEQVLVTAHVPPLVSGSSDIAFGVEGTGKTLATAMRDARITGQLMSMRGGKLAFDVAGLAAQGRQRTIDGNRGRARLEVAPERAEYDMLRASFRLDGRDLRLAPVEVVQDGWIIRGQGRADLAGQLIDWRLEAARAPAGGEAQASIAGSRGASERETEAISLHLTGTLRRPWVRYRMSELPQSGVDNNPSWWP